MNWQPVVSRAALERRAALLRDIRAYFSVQQVLEVQTPLLGLAGATDPALESFVVAAPKRPLRYLQTSPEFAMKRLLAAGSGDIYQICPAFRREEMTRLHREEFTLLEWYRLGFDHHRLMDDVGALLTSVGFPFPISRHAYRDLCRVHAGIDPGSASTAELAKAAAEAGARLGDAAQDRALLLDWLFGCRVLPALPRTEAVFIFDFPVEQAAYARVRAGDPPVGERFELVLGEMELANGFHEVTDAAEQRARHQRENARRRALGLPVIPLDEALLEAMESGLPPCSGVALGLDRLLMALSGTLDIRDVLPFDEPPR